MACFCMFSQIFALGLLIALMLTSVSTSETWEGLCKTSHRNNPEEPYLL